MNKLCIAILIIIMLPAAAWAKKNEPVPPPAAWTPMEPLGL